MVPVASETTFKVLLSCNMGIPASKDPILQCFLSPLFLMYIHAPK